MIKRYTTFYVNELKPIDFCGKTVMFQMDLNGAYETPFKTEPTTGEHDFNTCEGCQNTRKELIKILTKRFNGTEQKQGFPFCCSHHSNLTKVKEFNRASFISVPEMVADKIIYTNQHITNNHENENYYKDITDYIEYTVESFGKMPKGCGNPLYLNSYLSCISGSLKQNTEISRERKNRLLEFLGAYKTPPKKNKNTETKKNKNTDLNILLGTYQKWLKTFPFDISFFTELKPHFEKQLPILKGKPETNKYTGLAKFKMHTKSSLIDVLLNITKNLLDKINVPELRKQGAITDIQANQLEFAEAELKTKTAEITKQYSEGELKYVKTLKKWLQLHKDYFKEVAPLLKDLPPQQSEKQKPEQETPKTFDELFYNTDLVKPCVDILKELDPPLIDTDYNYIGKLKGVFCVWINEMQRQGVVKGNYPEERKLFAALIPQKIKRFSIDESMFGKYQKKAEDNFRADIKTKLSNIKLSQNSQ